MMKRKVLVLDIDGTLTNSKKEITPKTRQALLEIQRQGQSSFWLPADRQAVCA